LNAENPEKTQRPEEIRNMKQNKQIRLSLDFRHMKTTDATNGSQLDSSIRIEQTNSFVNESFEKWSDCPDFQHAPAFRTLNRYRNFSKVAAKCSQT
jgi:hypothetical protein